MRRRSEDSILLAAAVGTGLFLAARSAVRASRRYDFRGKTVFISGGSRGLGLLLAEQFGLERANVVVCARDADELERARAQLAGRGVRVVPVVCDVTRKDEVERAVRETVSRFGGIDVLVHNAGTIMVGPMEVMTDADYEEAMRTHFWAALHLTTAALPSMRARGGGRIVNISSIGGKIAVPHLLPYSASKFALTGFSEGLRAELKKDNIYVSTICPGLMRTGSPRNAFFKGKHRAEYAWFSISDALPLTSMDAQRAARRVLLACRRGEAEVVLSVQAKIAVKFHSIFPGLSQEIASLVHPLLPSAGGIGQGRAQGKDSQSLASPSFLTALNERAAAANNEIR
jgi:NAD(P)-dependent dehydrogenase (short-subunit alcohol dehydrogenase family)